MRIKVHRGTPINDGHTLCSTCRHSRVTRGRKLDEELTICGASHFKVVPITFQVTSCSGYDDQRLPTYFDLLQQAWILQPGSRRRPAGFVRASDLREEEFDQYMAGIRRDEQR